MFVTKIHCYCYFLNILHSCVYHLYSQLLDLIDVSTTHLSDYLKWCLIWQKAGTYLIASSCAGLFEPIKKLNCLCSTGYARMQCLTLHSFQHLSEHWMSFQAFCWYANCLNLIMTRLMLSPIFSLFSVLWM